MREIREESLAEVITLRPYDNTEQQPISEMEPIRKIGTIALLQAREPITESKADYDLSVMDTMGAYLARLGQVPLLKADEEVDLAKRYQAGAEAAKQLEEQEVSAEKRHTLQYIEEMGEQAKELLISSNLRLVVSIAAKKRYQNKGLDITDLIQEGNKGLIRAVEKYDHAKGYKFSTYATWWIKQALQRGVANGGRMVRIPTYAEEKKYKADQAEKYLREAIGREPSIEEVAEQSGVNSDLIRVFNQTKNIVSIHQPVGNESDASLEDFIEDKNSNFTQDIERDILLETVYSAISELNEKEQDVIRKRFGLDGSHPQTLDGIGQEHGLTRERIRQIEYSVKRKLRNNAELHEVYKDLIK